MMDKITSMVAKFTFSMLAKKIARIASIVFLVSAAIYFVWGPLAGNAFGAKDYIGIFALMMLIVAVVAMLAAKITAIKLIK
jgi:hypothetical protein